MSVWQVQFAIAVALMRWARTGRAKTGTGVSDLQNGGDDR